MESYNPFVSIIIPTYNRGVYLYQCLNSLLLQSYKNFEVIICDDGSTDDTFEIINSFKNKLNIIYDYSENTGGPAGPRNRGIILSNGELIAFLDSDDYWHTEKLRKSIMFFNSNIDLVYHDLEIYPQKNIFFFKKKIKTYQPHKKIFNDLMIRGNCITLSSAVLRKSILYDFELFNTSTDMVSVEDYDFWLRLSLKDIRFHRIKKCLGYYNNLNSNKLTKNNNRVDYVKYLHIYNKYKHLLSYDENMKAFYSTNFNLARISFLEKNYVKSLMHLKYIIKKFKFNIITIKSLYMYLFIKFKK